MIYTGEGILGRGEGALEGCLLYLVSEQVRCENTCHPRAASLGDHSSWETGVHHSTSRYAKPIWFSFVGLVLATNLSC